MVAARKGLGRQCGHRHPYGGPCHLASDLAWFRRRPRTLDVSSTPSAASVGSTAPIVNPGHLPGRDDVSTMASHHQFYEIPNFYFFPSCGRPCWLPLYQQPTEQSAFVTDGWPCEYYGPNYSSEPSCTQPPTRRTASETADPADKDSGDRLLVVCQLRQLGNGQTAPTIRNQNGQSSNIWDMVAVPASYISRDAPVVGKLSQVPGVPGFDEAFAPDIWLGNTGWHEIPVSRDLSVGHILHGRSDFPDGEPQRQYRFAH